jgi:tRNA G10  N-methylase Trm11
VIDPFVGTGGLLIPAAYHGATTFGSDIDARVIHGHGVGHLNKASTYKFPDNPIKPYMFYSFHQYGF